jgi:hypothetical protein
MSTCTKAPEGRLRLLARSPAGATIAERRATNIVLRHGAEIVARLFTGAEGSGPIDRIALGFGREAADVGTTALVPPENGNLAPEDLVSPVPADAFALETDEAARLVRVSIAAVFHPAKELPNVTEAGLLAGSDLYNQVVFEPVTLHVGQDITFFWEVDFPFGH